IRCPIICTLLWLGSGKSVVGRGSTMHFPQPMPNWTMGQRICQVSWSAWVGSDIRSRPALSGIEHGCFFRDPSSVGSEVFLENHAVVIDDEGHDSGRSVLRGEGYERKTANHSTPRQIAVRTSLCCRPLG